jgi:hypothetical protein
MATGLSTGAILPSFLDGTSLKLYDDDAKRNYEAVAKFSKRDADMLANWDAWLAGLASGACTSADECSAKAWIKDARRRSGSA